MFALVAPLLLNLTPPVPVVRADEAVPVVRIDDAPSTPRSSPWAALDLGAGVPSGATAQIALMPWGYAARFELGAGFDGAAAGFEGGLVLAPLHTILAPVLALQLGHFLEGDASQLLGSHLPSSLAPMLQHVGYDFASAELGLELGSPDNFVFTLRAGVAGVQSTLHELPSMGGAVTMQDANLTAVIPDARLGMVIFL